MIEQRCRQTRAGVAPRCLPTVSVARLSGVGSVVRALSRFGAWLGAWLGVGVGAYLFTISLCNFMFIFDKVC